MKRNFFIIVLLFLITFCNSQELNSKVSIDYSKISTTNPQIYKTLEKSLTDFVNKLICPLSGINVSASRPMIN